MSADTERFPAATSLRELPTWRSIRSALNISMACLHCAWRKAGRHCPMTQFAALRILTAPGVTTVVAVIEGELVGFAELFSDGELQAFLTNLAVGARYRGRGIGRALVEESLRVAGGERIDLLSEEASVGFYESFPHFRKPGFRLYPFHEASGLR